MRPGLARLFRLAAAALAAATAVACGGGDSADASVHQATARLDTLVPQWMARTGVPGVAVSVVHDGRTVYTRGFGVRRVDEAALVDADTAYMTSRGIRTLGVRLRQHHESSLKVAEWLAQHPQVERVNHPALPGSKGHEFWQRDFTGSSGLFSFVLKKRLNNDELASYLDNFSLFSMAYSWGGFESLILPNQPEQVAALRPGGEVDFSGTLIRLHIGLENVDDLIADLAAGFERIV